MITKISAGEKIRNVVISVITQIGHIKKYRIDDIDREVPYNLEFLAGDNIYNILIKLCDFYPDWEFFLI
ncbi:MAG: hypothetical protein RR115_02590 [Hydrogenoanaerobacterium sp.]